MEEMGKLFLTRCVGDTICIGENITIYFNKIDGGDAMMTIRAPKSISIDRGEIRIKKLKTLLEKLEEKW